MKSIAQARTKSESLLSASYLLPSMLALNTVALLALDSVGGIPDWLKTAAALFLSF